MKTEVRIFVPGIEGYITVTFYKESEARIFRNHLKDHRISVALVTFSENIEPG